MRYKKLNIIAFVFIMFFCFNIGDVRAGWCPSDSKFSSATSCEYKAGVTSREDVVIYFGKTTGGKYCSTVKSVKIGTWAWSWKDDNNGGASRKKFEFDFEDANKMQSSIFENNKCPRLKIVNEYKISSGKTEKVIISNKKLSGIPVLGEILDETACGVNQMVSLGSECWMADGIFSKISNDEMSATTIEANDERASNVSLVESIFAAARKWGTEDTGVSSDGSISCEALLGPDNIKIISDVLLVISVIGVILVIVLGMSDFVKAVASSDDDVLAKAWKKFKYRIISVVILLLLPVLVDFILSFVNDNLRFKKIDINGNPNGEVTIEVGKASDCN
ncbi:MAG: hypothetical protein IKE90_03230 [Bacilli bacterium]|nr:hypothetical protein [Bacilli bacterium]